MLDPSTRVDRRMLGKGAAGWAWASDVQMDEWVNTAFHGRKRCPEASRGVSVSGAALFWRGHVHERETERERLCNCVFLAGWPGTLYIPGWLELTEVCLPLLPFDLAGIKSVYPHPYPHHGERLLDAFLFGQAPCFYVCREGKVDNKCHRQREEPLWVGIAAGDECFQLILKNFEHFLL